MKYVVKPVLRLGEGNRLEVTDFQIKIIDEERGRILSTYINEDESLVLISYIIDRLICRYTYYINELRKELEIQYKKQDEIIQKVSKTEICITKEYCEANVEEYQRRIEIINNEIYNLIKTIMNCKYIIDKLKESLSAIRYIMQILKIDVEQDFVFI